MTKPDGTHWMTHFEFNQRTQGRLQMLHQFVNVFRMLIVPIDPIAYTSYIHPVGDIARYELISVHRMYTFPHAIGIYQEGMVCNAIANGV
jgi:hypothetical protein